MTLMGGGWMFKGEPRFQSLSDLFLERLGEDRAESRLS